MNVSGTPGDDVLTGTDFNDWIGGGAGNDLIHGGGRDDHIQGNEGDDTLYGDSGDDYILGLEDNDLLYGGPGNDYLDGGVGMDVLEGNEGDDTLYSEYDAASDILTGGSGADLFRMLGSRVGSIDRITDFSTAEGDLLDIGAREGEMTGRYSRWAGALTTPGFSLTLGQALPGELGVTDMWTWVSGGVTYLIVDNNDDSVLSIHDLVLAFDGTPDLSRASFTPGTFSVETGTSSSDVWTGSEVRDVYLGLSGDDSLFGAGGNDLLNGGAGADTLVGGDGDDELIGETGNDILRGGEGNDSLYAGMRLNSSQTDAGTVNELYGEGGNDFLLGRQGRDLLDGGDGDDTLNSGSDDLAIGGDLLRGGAGNDTLVTNGDVADGGSGDDRFVLGEVGSRLTGGAGADRYDLISNQYDGNFGAAPYNLVTDFSLADGDVFNMTNGASENLRLVFRGAIDNPAFDPVEGARFSSSDLGSSFRQVWTWFDGSLTWLMIDLDANGTLGAADYILQMQGHVTLTPQAFAAGSLYALSGGTSGDDVYQAGDSGERYFGLGGDDRISGGAGADTLYGDEGNDELRGQGGSDYLYGGGGNDLIYGDDGDDRIQGGAGNDTIFGGAGDDYIYADGTGAGDLDALDAVNVIHGGLGNDNLLGYSTGNQLYGDEGNDSLSGIGLLDGGDGDDSFVAGPLGARMIGGAGRDTMRGGDGDDYFEGGTGDDNMRGWFGNDVFNGGAGSDVINGEWGIDRAIYAGLFGSYTRIGDFSEMSISGGLEGGTDRVFDVEHVAFLDGHLSFETDSWQSVVYRMYDAAFDRGPDPFGMLTWAEALAGGMNLSVLSDTFEASAEFQARYGALNNEAFITEMYRFSLNREPDAPGLQHWLNFMNGGMTRAEVLYHFSESQEHKDVMTARILAQGMWIQDENTIAIARLYDSILDRLPDIAGLRSYRGQITDGGTLLQVAQALMGQPEYQTLYGGLSNQAFVEKMYQVILNRAGTTNEVATLTAQLDGGAGRADLLLGLSQSLEHAIAYQRTWNQQVRTLENGLYPSTSPEAGDKTAAEVLPAHADDAFVAEVLPGADRHDAKGFAAEVSPLTLDDGDGWNAHILRPDGDDAAFEGPDGAAAPAAADVAPAAEVLPADEVKAEVLPTAEVLPGDDEAFVAEVLPGAGFGRTGDTMRVEDAFVLTGDETAPVTEVLPAVADEAVPAAPALDWLRRDGDLAAFDALPDHLIHAEAGHRAHAPQPDDLFG